MNRGKEKEKEESRRERGREEEKDGRKSERWVGKENREKERNPLPENLFRNFCFLP